MGCDMQERAVIRLPWSLILLALVAGGCESVTAPPIDSLPRQLSPAEVEVVETANAFGFDVLREVRARETGPNVVLSPLSASMALGMAMNGADGETLEAILRTLRLDHLSEAAANEAYRDLTRLLVDLDRRRVELGIANSAWLREGATFHDDYVERLRDYFDAEVRELDFLDPASLDAINGWVRERTRGRIPEIIDRIDPLNIYFLINAVYFKAPWTREFDPRRTRDAPFRRADGSTVTVPMMSMPETELPFLFTDRLSAVRLAYGGGAFEMVVVVPRHDLDLSELVDGLDAQEWDAWMNGFTETRGLVQLPRFRVEYDTGEELLSEALKDLGMAIAFRPEADFSRMTPGSTEIAYVRQATFLEVDERGTEAAAATVVAGPTSLPPHVFADRPFLLAIRERFSGTILFIGTIGDPTA